MCPLEASPGKLVTNGDSFEFQGVIRNSSVEVVKIFVHIAEVAPKYITELYDGGARSVEVRELAMQYVRHAAAWSGLNDCRYFHSHR